MHTKTIKKGKNDATNSNFKTASDLPRSPKRFIWGIWVNENKGSTWKFIQVSTRELLLTKNNQ